jgi:hypothetical protein
MSDRATHALRYLGGGDRKIAAIKLVRELTHLGLAQAKAVVDQQQVFAEGLDHASATAIVERFAREADSKVAILDEADHLHAFDPRHPLRGDQPLVRLRRHGPRLAWERGRIGEWTREREVAFESADACEQAIAAEQASWAERGLAWAEHELDVVRQTSARELQLEQAIREAESPEEAMAVHADWLQRQGDPRGLIAALDLAQARAESLEQRSRLQRAFADALVEHRAHLFGPLFEARGLFEATWRGGLVVGLDIDRNKAITQDWPLPFGDLQLAEYLLALPICACLRSLRIHWVGAGGPAFANKLMHSDPALLAGLRELALTSHYEFEGFVDWSRMPRLERLALVVGAMTPIVALSLRELVLTLWRPDTAIAALRESKLPHLHSLTLRFDADAFHGGWPEVPIAGMLAELLGLPILGSLAKLALDNIGEPWPRWVAQILVDAPRLRTIGQVDLSQVAFEPDARALLLDARPRMPNVRIA